MHLTQRQNPMAKNSQEGRKWTRRKKPKRDKSANRTYTVGVRLSEAEYAELVAEATTCSKSKAELLRACWLGTAVVTNSVGQPARVMSEWDSLLYKGWVGVANNLHKLTGPSQLSGATQLKIAELLAQLEPALADFRQRGGWYEIEQSEEYFQEFTA